MSFPFCTDPAPAVAGNAGGFAGLQGLQADGTRQQCTNSGRPFGYHEYGLAFTAPPSGGYDIEGIVQGGGDDPIERQTDFVFTCALGACEYPHLAQGDNPCHHRDRDINFSLIPTTDSNRTTRRNAVLDTINLSDLDSTRGSIRAEVEWMFFFPTWPSSEAFEGMFTGNTPDDPSSDTRAFPGDDAVGTSFATYQRGLAMTPRNIPPWSNSVDSGFLGVPYRGDEIVMRGRTTYDCGHSWGGTASGPGPGYDPNISVLTHVSCGRAVDCLGTNSCSAGPPSCAAYGSDYGLFWDTDVTPEDWGCRSNYSPVTYPADYSGLCSCQGTPGVCVQPEAWAAEIHPFTAAMWLHPDPAAERDGKIWIRAMSHEPVPIGGGSNIGDAPGGSTRQAFGATPMVTTFHVPGGPSPTGEDLYIEPVRTDWVLDPQAYNPPVVAIGTTSCFASIPGGPSERDQPWAYWRAPSGSGKLISQNTAGNAGSFFTISPTDNGDGTLTVHVTQVAGTERNNFETPAIVGAHLRVCYPVCANGIKQNTCPGACKPIVDGGFEAQASVALGSPWATQVATYDSVFNNNFTTPTICYNGRSCGEIASSNASATWNWDSINQTINLTSHTPYHLSAWVRNDSNTAYGYLGVGNIGSTILPRNLTGWTQVTYNFSSASNTSLNIYAGLSQVPGLSQNMYVDDFALIPARFPDEMVTDASFEYDTTNTTPGNWGALGAAWSSEGGNTGVYTSNATWPAHSGSYVGIVQPPSGWHGIYQRIPVLPNTSYLATIWARTSSAIGASNGFFRVVDQNWTYELATTSFGSLPNWRQLTVSFDSGSFDYVYIEAGISAGNSSWLMLDGASVRGGGFDCSQCSHGCDASNAACLCPACTATQRNACSHAGLVCVCGDCQ